MTGRGSSQRVLPETVADRVHGVVALKKKPEGGRDQGIRGVRMTSLGKSGSRGSRTNRAEG